MSERDAASGPHCLDLAESAISSLDLLISGSVLDEALATAILARQDVVLTPRRAALARAFVVVAAWHATREAARLDLLRPDAGALCCLRLAADRFYALGLERFWGAVPANGLRLARGAWFGETDRVFRLGFGHVETHHLSGALAAVSRALDPAVR